MGFLVESDFVAENIREGFGDCVFESRVHL